MYDEEYWDDDDEDEEEYPYQWMDDLWNDDDDYYGVEYDREYQRGLLNPIQRVWFDFTCWLYYTSLYRRWSSWRWSRKYHIDDSEIPF